MFQPAPGLLIEVLCFQSGLAPINTFDIFRGMVDDERSDVAILLNHPVTEVRVVDGIVLYNRPAIPDDGMVILHEDDYNNIYWKYHTLPRRRPKKTASETKPAFTYLADPAKKAVRTLEFGGKKRKSTKKKRLL